jgi:hypothetical protein
LFCGAAKTRHKKSSNQVFRFFNQHRAMNKILLVDANSIEGKMQAEPKPLSAS